MLLIAAAAAAQLNPIRVHANSMWMPVCPAFEKLSLPCLDPTHELKSTEEVLASSFTLKQSYTVRESQPALESLATSARA